MRAVGGEGRAFGGGAVSSPPASWLGEVTELIRIFDEGVFELHLSLWEDAFTAEQQGLAYFFLGEA